MFDLAALWRHCNVCQRLAEAAANLHQKQTTTAVPIEECGDALLRSSQFDELRLEAGSHCSDCVLDAEFQQVTNVVAPLDDNNRLGILHIRSSGHSVVLDFGVQC